MFATPARERREFGVLVVALIAASAGAGAVYLGAELLTPRDRGSANEHDSARGDFCSSHLPPRFSAPRAIWQRPTPLRHPTLKHVFSPDAS